MITNSPHSESLAFAEFFQQRFASGDIVGAEMPVGEGRNYAIAMDTAHHKLYCSCPFYPKPCLHALALAALVRREGAALFPNTTTTPDWLAALLAGQPSHTVRSGSNPEQRAAAQQKTRFERLERAANGFEDLEAWLNDTARRGLATLISEDPAAFDHIAARAADASMTGLSRTLRLVSKIPANAPEWTTQAADVLAQIYLAVRAFRKRAALPDALLYDLQNFIGIAVKKEEVLASGERLEDTWAVLGSLTEALEDKLSVRRTWLLGAKSSRMALLLDFAFGGGGFDPGFATGSIQQGTLAFYPSAFPQRVLALDDLKALPKKVEKVPGNADIELFLTDYAAALAAQPWLAHYAAVLHSIQPFVEKNGRFALADISGKMLPLSVPERTGWALIALSGGNPISVFGEWNGQMFRPLSAVAEGRLADLVICYSLFVICYSLFVW